MWWSSRVFSQPEKKDGLLRPEKSPYRLIMGDEDPNNTKSKGKTSVWELKVEIESVSLARETLRGREQQLQTRLRSVNAALEFTSRGIERAAARENELEREIRDTVAEDEAELANFRAELKGISEFAIGLQGAEGGEAPKPKDSQSPKIKKAPSTTKGGLDDSVDEEISNLRSLKELQTTEEFNVRATLKDEEEVGEKLEEETAEIHAQIELLLKEKESLQGSRIAHENLNKKQQQEQVELRERLESGRKEEEKEYMMAKAKKFIVGSELAARVQWLQSHTEGFLGLCQRLSHEHVRVQPRYPNSRPCESSGRQDTATLDHLRRMPPSVLVEGGLASSSRPSRDRGGGGGGGGADSPFSEGGGHSALASAATVTPQYATLDTEFAVSSEEFEDRQFDEQRMRNPDKEFAAGFVSSLNGGVCEFELANRYVARLCENATWEGRKGWERIVWGEDVNLYTGKVLPDTIHAPVRSVELIEEHFRKREKEAEEGTLDRRCLSKKEFDEMMAWDEGRSRLSNVEWDDQGAGESSNYRGRHRAAPPAKCQDGEGAAAGKLRAAASAEPGTTAGPATSPDPTNSISQMHADLRNYGYCVLAGNVGVGSGPGGTTVPPFFPLPSPAEWTGGQGKHRPSTAPPPPRVKIQKLKDMAAAAAAEKVKLISTKWPIPPPRREPNTFQTRWVF